MILVFAFSSLRNLVTLPVAVRMHGFGNGRLGDLHKNQASWMLCFYGALICTVSFAVKAMVCEAYALNKSIMNSYYEEFNKHINNH